MILLSNIEYPKLKSNEGNRLRIYCKAFAASLISSKPLKSKITVEPKAPKMKFNRIFFWLNISGFFIFMKVLKI